MIIKKIFLFHKMMFDNELNKFYFYLIIFVQLGNLDSKFPIEENIEPNKFDKDFKFH